MSRLGAVLKNRILDASGMVRPAPERISAVYKAIASDAQAKGVGFPAWLCIAAGTTVTMNSPDAFKALYKVASTRDAVLTAELMREIGLKSIGFNGIPRTINTLNAFRSALPASVTSELNTAPARECDAQNIESVRARGQALWRSIYDPFHDKLHDKLADAHPDLPVHILLNEYGALFADPPDHKTTIGRVLTSLVAIACLRAQGGCGLQVRSHVLGLRKAFEDGTANQQRIEGGEWLAGDQGSLWVLSTTDKITDAFARLD